MNNPWSDLPESPPYVLPSDETQVLSFNRRANDLQVLRLELLPEPYLGRVDAPIVLLNLNPGFTAADLPLYKDVYVRDLWRRNISHEPLEYPFYMLDPAIATAPGPRWWRRTLNKLITLTDEKTVANNVLCIEYFPYHSKRRPNLRAILPSQHYGFHLLEQAINRNAVVLSMRAHRVWRSESPRLNTYDNLFEARNPQQAIVGIGNYPEGFPLVARLLRS